MNEEIKESGNCFRALAKDTLLKKPYIDSDRNAYLFIDELAAKGFRNSHQEKNIDVVKVDNKNMIDIESICYAAGAIHLMIIGSDEQSEKVLLEEKNLKRAYYNGDLNANLGLQLREQNQEAKERLYDCKYILAVNIDKNREDYIYYASAKSKSGKHVILAFSDLNEYDKWAKDYGKTYKPLELDFLGLQRIGKNHGYLINPMGSRFYLSPNLILAVQKMRERRLNKKGE